MNKNLTEMILIVDRSGSMAGLEADTVGGINALLEKQRKQEGELLVTTVLFDDRTEWLYDRTPGSRVEPLSDRQYYVRGSTALLDAMAEVINTISAGQRYARSEDRPARTIVAITTDGMENASRRYRYAEIKEMVEARKKEGWEFLFLGANIDAFGEAERIGIHRDCAVKSFADRAGTGAAFAAINDAVSMMRRDVPLDGRWKKAVEEDAETRK